MLLPLLRRPAPVLLCRGGGAASFLMLRPLLRDGRISATFGVEFRGDAWRGLCEFRADKDQFSDDDEFQCDFENQKPSSSIVNMYEWRRKFSLLLRNTEEQEIISRDRRDWRDYEQISDLAQRMGLYSELYGKVVVTSKVPLPNYRADLDEKRPQREVVMSLSLQRRIERMLQKHLNPTIISSGNGARNVDEAVRETYAEDVCPDENHDSPVPGLVMEKSLQKRSLQMRELQKAWQGMKMLSFRKSLPAYKMKEKLLSAIAHNQVVVITGETGCGKTTQLPQCILESETESGNGALCNIICTQPRRISARAVAERVASERGENLGKHVGYKVRLEGLKGKDTCLLFCTSGILLRRLLVDPNLNGVTHVFVDEIHERGMNEDFLLVVLKNLLPRRQDLRLILMSATLNAELFSNFFGGSPTLHIPGFTYPVRANFLEDVLEVTGYKLTPVNQIDNYCKEDMWKTQRQLVPWKRKNSITELVEDALTNSKLESYSSFVRDSLACWSPDSMGFDLIEAVLCHICQEKPAGAVLVFMTGWDDISRLKDKLKVHHLLGDSNRVLLLTCHGSMATSEQKLIFDKAPPNIRKVILATNIAETSITIDDIVFVIDCGKAKETTYDALNNTPCLLPSWISQASARQRRGRAGRVQPGECFHLYPRCVYDAFVEFQLPELLRTPLNSLCLQIKSLQLGTIEEFLSAALQSPEPLAVQNAIKFLKMIGALDVKENLTSLGHYLSMLPVDPKLGKMLIMGAIFRCLDPILTIVSGLSVRDPFLLPQDKKNLAGSVKLRFAAVDYSDHMALVRAYEGWHAAKREGSANEYCWSNFLSAQTLQAIHSLKKQFYVILRDCGLSVDDSSTINSLCHNQSIVRAIICSGLSPGIASIVHREKPSFKTMDDGVVLLSTNSVNARYQTIPYPWLVFSEKIKVNTVYLCDSTAVSDATVILFGGSLRQGEAAGRLRMLDGYIDFFMDPDLAKLFWNLKEELDKLVQKKLEDPTVDVHKEGKYLLLAVQELISTDLLEGRFIFGHEAKKMGIDSNDNNGNNENSYLKGVQNPKGLLQTLLMRAGHSPAKYKSTHLKSNEFRSLVEFKGMQFVGKPKKNKQLAERDAAMDALRWLIQKSDDRQERDDDSPLEISNNVLKLLGKPRWPRHH